VCGRRPSEAAHFEARGTRAGDPGNLYPACHFHHCQQHWIGIWTFQRLHQLDLPRLCAELWQHYLEVRKPPEAFTF